MRRCRFSLGRTVEHLARRARRVDRPCGCRCADHVWRGQVLHRQRPRMEGSLGGVAKIGRYVGSMHLCIYHDWNGARQVDATDFRNNDRFPLFCQPTHLSFPPTCNLHSAICSSSSSHPAFHLNFLPLPPPSSTHVPSPSHERRSSPLPSVDVPLSVARLPRRPHPKSDPLYLLPDVDAPSPRLATLDAADRATLG